jgi:DNA modification methylase
MEVVKQAQGEGWSLYQGDSAEILQGLPADSVDLAIFSPPFAQLFTYSNSERDLGNVKNDAEFFEHYTYVSRELYRVLKPGRVMGVHSMDLLTTKSTHGVEGLRDFTGGLIRHHQADGFVYRSRVTIDRCPQALAIRHKAKSLLFAQMDRDRGWLAPAFPDYLLIFRKPGENAVPINDASVDREEWIKWARPVYQEQAEDRAEQLGTHAWYDIRETNTLNVAAARGDNDERHMCPLSLDIIERAVRLWSNRGEVVLSPFAGVGSEGVGSLRHGRRFVGVELKESYFNTACNNLREAERQSRELTLFDMIEREAV